MIWINLTVGSLNDARAANLITAARTTVLATGQADPVPNLIAQVQAEIRGMIGFSGKYPLDADSSTSIPPNLKDLAVQKICREVKARLNLQMTEQDREDEKVYQARLLLISQGKWPIDAPDNAATVNPDLPTGKIEYIPGFVRQYTRCGLSNL
jgi:hypothetical protein